MGRKLRDQLMKAKTAIEAMALENRLVQSIKKIRKDKKKVVKAEVKRKAKILGVSRKITKVGSKQRKAAIKKEEKKVVKAEVKKDAIKLKLKAAAKGGKAKTATKLQKQLRQEKKQVKKLKKKEMKTKYAPSARVKVVTKLAKKELVKERKKSLKKVETKRKIKGAEMQATAKMLRNAKDTPTILKLSQKIIDMRKKMNKEAQKIVKKEKKVLNAKKITSSPLKKKIKSTDALIAKLKGEIVKHKSRIGILKKKINATKDPTKVKKEAREMSDTKKRVSAAYREIARLKGRVTKMKKVQAMPKKRKKKLTVTKKIAETSKKVKTDKKIADVERAKLAAAKAALAGAINAVVRTKEGVFKARVKKEKAAVKIDASALKKVKRRGKRIRKEAKTESAAANDLKKLKQALVTGNFAGAKAMHMAKTQAKKVKEIKKKKADAKLMGKNPDKRAPAKKAMARTVMATLDPSSGSCTKGNCCFTTFKDFKCKKKKSAMCVKYTNKKKLPEKWRSVLGVRAVFKRKPAAPSTVKSIAYNRTMFVEAHWAPGNKGKYATSQMLRLRLCGKFTKFGSEGANVCIPKKGMGISLSKIGNFPAGSCVRATDFAAVARQKMKKIVKKWMYDNDPKRMKELAMKKAKKLAKKPKQVDKITNAVRQAIGGAFKGSMGGVSLGEAHNHPDKIEFIDETEAERKGRVLGIAQMLSYDGSFMITAVESAKKMKKKAKKVAAKNRAAKGGEELDTEVVELSSA